MTGAEPAVEPKLMMRFRNAGAKIAWKSVEHGRRAHLHDEESLVELRTSADGEQLWTEAGPVGALVILLEIDRRGPATFLAGVESSSPTFRQGALIAGWGGPLPDGAKAIHLEDLVAVARYALA
jgi:hypothetical protein